MSLRAFHLFFISLSVVLAVFFSAWATGQYRQGGEAGYVLVAIAALLVAGGLTLYGSAFRKKTRYL